MRLPYAAKARVERTKIVDDLPSLSHPDGSAKARFFIRFGFSSEKWKIFAPALKEHGGAHDVSASIESRHGTGYSVDGSLKTADLGAKDTERIPNHKDTTNG
jgi:hypothetical protein